MALSPARPQRPALRWVAGAVGVGLAASATLLAAAPAGAAGEHVSAVFSVTGVSTSNCSVSTGGADIYIEPGATLQAKSAIVGVTVLGVPLDLSKVGGFEGELTIDPGTRAAKQYDLSAEQNVAITGLSAGNHKFTWAASAVTALGIPVPLGLDAEAAKAGAALAYAGTIHVTEDAPDCGIAVQVPGPSASVSVTNLPPVVVTVPPIDVKVPVDPDKVLPPKPKTPEATPKPAYTPPAKTIPEQVVPKGNGGTFLGDGSGFFGGALPDVNPSGEAHRPEPTATATPAASAPPFPSPSVNPQDREDAKQPDLAANKAPSAELPVLLAILAVIALALVTATYARLYLLRRD